MAFALTTVRYARSFINYRDNRHRRRSGDRSVRGRDASGSTGSGFLERKFVRLPVFSAGVSQMFVRGRQNYGFLYVYHEAFGSSEVSRNEIFVVVNS